jgi:hypothetical protein
MEVKTNMIKKNIKNNIAPNFQCNFDFSSLFFNFSNLLLPSISFTNEFDDTLWWIAKADKFAKICFKAASV